MTGYTRYQGLIIQDHKILLIRGYEILTGISFWVIPGGHRESGELEEDCLVREMKEETNLDVRVEKLLDEVSFALDGSDAVHKSYLVHADRMPAGPRSRTGG